MLPGWTALVLAQPKAAIAADHVVDLVLVVRLLRVAAAGRQDVEAEAQRRHAQEFEIELVGLSALAVQLGEFEGAHGRPSPSPQPGGIAAVPGGSDPRSRNESARVPTRSNRRSSRLQ